MEDNLVTCDKILSWLQKKVEAKEEVAPATYLDASLKLSVLIGDEEDKLFDLQQRVAECRVVLIESGKSAVEARMRTEASEIYKAMMKQKAKISRIFEFIRIIKIRSRLKTDEMYSM